MTLTDFERTMTMLCSIDCRLLLLTKLFLGNIMKSIHAVTVCDLSVALLSFISFINLDSSRQCLPHFS